MMINVIKDGVFEGYMYLTLHFHNESDDDIAEILDVEKETYYTLLKKFKAEQMNPYDMFNEIDHAFKSKENCLQCREFISKNANTDEMKITYDISDNYMGICFNGLGGYNDLLKYLELENIPKMRRKFLKKFNAHDKDSTAESKWKVIRFFQKIEETIDRKSKLEESLNTLDERLSECIPYKFQI